MDDAVNVAVSRWLVKAANDLRTAETMISVVPPVTDTACFHAQQTVEKALKAFLTVVDKHVQKTHDLQRLVELCAAENKAFVGLASIAEELADYAVTGRYPDDWRDIPASEAESAVGMAREALQFVRGEIERQAAE